MLGWLRRRPRSRGHPTPAQALAALSEGACMYAALNKCSERGLQSVGLRDEEDVSCVLVCNAHYGRLRKLDARQADELERVLREAFAHRLYPAGVA